jgi:hypothetical protein
MSDLVGARSVGHIRRIRMALNLVINQPGCQVLLPPDSRGSRSPGQLEFSQASPRLQELTSQRAQPQGRQAILQERSVQPMRIRPTRAVVRRYVRDLQSTLKEGRIVEQRAFIQSFVKRIEIDHPMAELHYTCPLTPPWGCKPLSQEVLDMVKTGSSNVTLFITTLCFWVSHTGGRIIEKPGYRAFSRLNSRAFT